MATFKLYRLHFLSPLHIGDQRGDNDISLKTIHSDTLYAALMSCMVRQGKPIPDNGELGFTISSLFPYYQKTVEDAPTYFLPLPKSSNIMHSSIRNDSSVLKKMKKVAWIDAKYYRQCLDGKDLLSLSTEIMHGAYFTSTPLPTDNEGHTDFIVSSVVQRATIPDRTGIENTKPYFVDRVLFRNHAGLYFIAYGNTDVIDAVLPLLAQEGLGTDRNVGYGCFDYKVDTLEIDHPESSDYCVSLSTLIPENEQQLKEMLSGDEVAYDLARRGGWITTPPYSTLRKNAIYAFLPGSVFSLPYSEEKSVIGKIVNLRPECGELTPKHPIWRNGKSILLPIKR